MTIFFARNLISIFFSIFQHYPGKAKINLNIPHSSPELNIKSSPSSISPAASGNSIHSGLKKYSPVNGDTLNSTADKKKISITSPSTPLSAPPAPLTPQAPVAIPAPALPPLPSVTIYIKVHRSKCNNLGPYLDPTKVSHQVPDQVRLFSALVNARDYKINVAYEINVALKFFLQIYKRSQWNKGTVFSFSVKKNAD